MKGLTFLVMSVLIAPVAVLSGNAVAEAPQKLDTFADCISRERNLDVLMLVDESKSLRVLTKNGIEKPGNDPNDDRVAALKSVITVLKSSLSATQNSTEESGLRVNVSLAGFGDKYVQRLGFTELQDSTVSKINESLDDQKSNDSDLHTRYQVALEGAKKAFRSHGDQGTCRLLMWFSDGQHDDDDKSGFSIVEKKQIEKTVCGAGGLVDQLRTDGVYIVAAGLNSDPKQLGLMRMIAEGGDTYNSNGFSKEKNSSLVNVSQCGDTEPFGTFETARDAEKIVEAIFRALRNVPGIPKDRVNTAAEPLPIEICKPEGEKVCEGFRFSADASVQSFNILVSRPNVNVAIEVVMPDKSRRTVLAEQGELSELPSDLVTITRVTGNKALISAHQSRTNNLAGDWYVSFKGKDVAGSTGYISFVGVADIELMSPPDKNGLNEINRNVAPPLKFKVKSKDDVSSIQKLAVSFVNGDSSETINAFRLEDGTFEIDGIQVERILKSPLFQNISNVSIQAEPIGQIDGLTIVSDDGSSLDDEAVTAKFPIKKFEFAVRNGASFPVCYNYAGPDLRFIGTPKISIKLTCRGPDSGSGTITFGDFETNKGAFEVIESKKCTVAVREDESCDLTIKPNVETFDRTALTLGVMYGDESGKVEKAKLTIPIITEKKPVVINGLKAALILVLLFLFIQGLVRLGITYLVARFSKLADSARIARLEAVVDRTGSIKLINTSSVVGTSNEGFAFAHESPKSTFELYGFRFAASPVRLFFRSTSRPLGDVTKPGFVVIGSGGHRGVVKSTGDVSGQVGLSLRKQWVVALKTESLSAMADSLSEANAEVIVFLDPYAVMPFEAQMGELDSSINLGNFPGQLSALVELMISQRNESANSDGLDSHTTSIKPGNSDPDGFDNLFGVPPKSVTDQSDNSVKTKSKKTRKKKKKSDNDNQVIEPISNPNPGDWDLFN